MQPASAVVRGCCRTYAAQTGTRFRFQRWKPPRPASSYEHRFPLLCRTLASFRPGAESVLRFFNQGRGLSPYPEESDDAQLFAQTRTLRIRQRHGFDFSIEFSTSPLRAVAILTLSDFHEVSRAGRPYRTATKTSPFLAAAFTVCTSESINIALRVRQV